MRIRDFKYTPEDVDCRYCTKFIRGRCRANGCPWLNERIEAGVIGYTEALDETFLEFAPLRRRVKLVSACSHSFWKDEQHWQRFAAAQAIFGIYRKRNTPAYYAALYILTSDDSLFRRTADCVRKKKIDFRFANVRNMTVSQYALYKTAKSLYNESRKVSIDEFADPSLFGLEEFKTAVNASVRTAYAASTGKTVDSLLKLLDALVEKVSIDYADLVPEDKYTLLLDIFENRQLKQAMEYVDSRVILSTVHGAKGLEWDYVIVCDVEQWAFTFICRDCPSKSTQGGARCRLPQNIPTQMVEPLLDDLCVFYVALTRAKKQVFISASGERYNARGRQFTGGKICCFALVNGVRLINAAPNKSGD